MEKNRIILVSEFFYPDESTTSYIFSKIAGALVKDFELLILTGSVYGAERSQKKSLEPLIGEELIYRSWAPKFNKNNLLARFLGFVILTIDLSWKTFVKSRQSDIVFTVTNPAPLIVALAIIRKLRRFQLVLLVHDVFPENVVGAGVITRNNFLYRLLKSIFDWAYQSADQLITIGRDMSEVIRLKTANESSKITMIENWSHNPLISQIARDQSMIITMGLLNHIVIQYSGNIGRAQGLLEFIDLALKSKNKLNKFVFRGSGALLPLLKNKIQGHNKFIMGGSYSRSDQAEFLGACDVALVVLAPDMYGLGVPSKAYNILAAGKPILFLGPKNSEIYRLINFYKVGWAFDWGETDRLIDLIDGWSIDDLPLFEAIGKKARRIAETIYPEDAYLSKFKIFFCGLSNSKR
jgi:glycosyltransferase involved in cell wall biosynthesis